jgi:hypothetical protein
MLLLFHFVGILALEGEGPEPKGVMKILCLLVMLEKTDAAKRLSRFEKCRLKSTAR